MVSLINSGNELVIAGQGLIVVQRTHRLPTYQRRIK